MLHALLVIIYLIVCAALILLILLQASRGTGLSGAFGTGGGAENFLGAASSATVVMKIAIGCAIAFLVLSITFTMLPHEQRVNSVMMDNNLVTLEENRQQAKTESAPEQAASEGAAQPAGDTGGGQ